MPAKLREKPESARGVRNALRSGRWHLWAMMRRKPGKQPAGKLKKFPDITGYFPNWR
jgi:hypothetical protein